MILQIISVPPPTQYRTDWIWRGRTFDHRGCTYEIHMKYIFIVVFCIGLACSSVAADWECFKGSPERTSSSDDPAPDTPYLLWEMDLSSELFSSPVVKNGKVFQVGFEKIFCMDLDTREILWVTPTPAYHSTPYLSEDHLIVATNRGISALSINDGDVVWEYKITGRFSKAHPLFGHIISSPIVSEGIVVGGTMPYRFAISSEIRTSEQDEFHIVSIDESTGKERWYVKTINGVATSPCVAHGKVFAASRGRFCIDLEGGEVIWHSEDSRFFDFFFRNFKEARSTPALYHGMIVAGSSLKEILKIVVMDQYTGDIFWEWDVGDTLASSIALRDGRVYFYPCDGNFYCLSLLEGKEVWRTAISAPVAYDHGDPIWSSPAVADGKVYVGTIDGTFYCLDAYTGEVLWQYETGGPIHASPAVTDGKVLIASTDGKLYCFGIDPAKYKSKALNYIEDGNYIRAEDFLLNAREYTEHGDEKREIDDLIESIQTEKEEQEGRLEKISEAETLMDNADEILWDKEFEEAESRYGEAMRIYEEPDNEFGVSFCEMKVAYIQRRIVEDSEEKKEFLSRIFIAICVVAVIVSVSCWILYKKKKTKR